MRFASFNRLKHPFSFPCRVAVAMPHGLSALRFPLFSSLVGKKPLPPRARRFTPWPAPISAGSPATPHDSKPARSQQNRTSIGLRRIHGIAGSLGAGSRASPNPAFPRRKHVSGRPGKAGCQGLPLSKRFPLPTGIQHPATGLSFIMSVHPVHATAVFRFCGMPGSRMSNPSNRLPFVYFFRYSTLLRCSTIGSNPSSLAASRNESQSSIISPVAIQ